MLSPEQDWEGLHKVGGASLVVAGVLYLVNLALLFTVLSSAGLPPSDGQALLRYLYGQRLLGETISLVFLTIDGLLIVGLVVLYFASKSRTRFALGTVLGVVALTFDLVSTVVTVALIGLSVSFAAATTEGERIAYGAVAKLANGLTFQFGESFFFIMFSVSILILSLSAINLLGKKTCYLGVAAAFLGIVGGLTGIIPLIILWSIWFIAVGYDLFRRPN
jgi:hypothetical protein